jgi:hypothetical protein
VTLPNDRVAEGGCLCGAVRYRAAGAGGHPTLCHCGSCRRASGAPVVAWVTFPRQDFAFTRGTPVRYRSSPPVVRSFCGACGTALTYERADFPEAVDVTTASLDEPERFAPADHTWDAHRLPWLRLSDDLPRFPRSRHEP